MVNGGVSTRARAKKKSAAAYGAISWCMKQSLAAAAQVTPGECEVPNNHQAFTSAYTRESEFTTVALGMPLVK